ncbi:MAG: phage terminase large subunit [Phycisphaerales bacterium]|nr:phage terminase large subunit [Phycisphaerales bacterium]
MISGFLSAQSRVQVERRKVATQSPEMFARVYLASTCNRPFSRMHRELFELLLNAQSQRAARIAIAAPRGHAKSTIVALAHVLWCALYARERLILLVSATKPQATTLLSHVKEQVTKNERLLADFQDVCHREGGRGQPKPWRDNQICLKNGVMIRAYGARQGIRGTRHGDHRPGLIIVDDLEDSDEVIVEEQRQKLSEWFNGTLLKAGHPETNVVVVGTILHHDSLLAKLVDPRIQRGWLGRTYKAVEAFSERPDLWEAWSSIYHDRAEHEGCSGREAARAYFEANKELMLRGAKVLWPELESYLDLMEMREAEGRASFQAEKQNEPLDPEQCLFAGHAFHYWDDEYRDERHLLDTLGSNARFFGACDPSLGTKHGDYSAIIVLVRDRKTKINYILAADLNRRTPDETIQRIVQYAKRYEFQSFAVESNHFQQLMIQKLEDQTRAEGRRLKIKPITSRTNKNARIASLEPDVAQGHLRFYKRHQILLDQLRQFPVGKHDDGPDALEMAVDLACKPVHTVVCGQM